MKKQTISSAVAAALVVSVVPAAVADASTATAVQIKKVTAVDSTNVQVTYVKAGKTVTSKVKATKVIKHGAKTVQFKLQGKNYTQKLAKAFSNSNYISANSQVAKAKVAISKGMTADAVAAVASAESFLAKLKTTDVSVAQYKKLSQEIASLKTALESTTADFSAADVLKQSLEKMNAVKSMDSAFDTTMKMSMMGESMNMKMTGTMSMISEPILVKMDMVVDMGELGGKQTMQMYMEEANGKYITYAGMDGQWVKEETEAVSQDKIADMQVYMDSLTNVKAVGKETLQGKELYVVEGTLSGDTIEKFIQQSGALDTAQITAAAGTEDMVSAAELQKMVEAMLKDIGDLKMRMWVDPETYYSVKYEIDATDMMQKLMTNMMKQIGADLSKEEQSILTAITIDKMVMTMTNSNFDAVKAFTIPADVKSKAVASTAATAK